MFLFACIFIPEEPQKPDGKFIDRLNLQGILSENVTANFSFNSYRELFENSENIYYDIIPRAYSAQEFITQLNTMNSDTAAVCFWTTQSGEEYISMSEPTQLGARNYKFFSKNAKNTQDTIKGEVRITIKYTEMSGWQITQWKEIGEDYSCFHPVYGVRFGN
jgi:hypothetical protein